MAIASFWLKGTGAFGEHSAAAIDENWRIYSKLDRTFWYVDGDGIAIFEKTDQAAFGSLG